MLYKNFIGKIPWKKISNLLMDESFGRDEWMLKLTVEGHPFYFVKEENNPSCAVVDETNN